jgi:hypothetical protein
MRGSRYYIEFPIAGKNINAFQILVATQQFLSNGKENGVKVITNDSYQQGDTVSYLIDY